MAMTWATTNQQYDTVLSNCGKMSFETSGWNWIFPIKAKTTTTTTTTTRLCPNVFRKVAKKTTTTATCQVGWFYPTTLQQPAYVQMCSEN